MAEKKSIVFPALKKSLWQLMGPSVIMVALSLSGGEFLLWPNLAANFGLGILWPIPIILFLQFIINIEIERYTLVTGKSVEEHLAGRLMWLAIFFAVTVVLTLVWPAWVTTSGNLIAVVFGMTGDAARNTGLLFSLLLLSLSLHVFRHPSSYALLEKISRFGVITAILIILGIVITRFQPDIFLEGIRGLFNIGYIPEDMPRFAFVAALAYGGVAGMLNLVQSEWVMDKGYGVAGLKDGDKERVELHSDASRKNFKTWFHALNKEHFLIFFCANVFSIFLLAFLGRLLLPIGSAEGFEVLVAEIHALNAAIPFLGVLFGTSAAIMFAMAQLTILDSIGRLAYRLLTPVRARDHHHSFLRFLCTLRREDISIYAGFIAICILLASLVVPSFRQPFFLLVTSAVLSSFMMWLYPPFLLRMNLDLPAIVRPHPLRIMLVMVATLFYGLVSLWALSPYLPMWVTVTVGLAVTAYQIKYLVTKRVL